MMMHQAVAGPSQANRLDKGVVKDMSFFERMIGGHRLTNYLPSLKSAASILCS
jgi:hypothetical protein